MNKRDFMTGLIIRGMTVKGYHDLHTMHRNAKGARKKNDKLLFHILKTNETSEYGRKYHFDEIKTVEDYRRMVPTITYSDIEEYTRRMSEDNEENVLTSLPLVGYAQSSGSVGKRKLVPLTQPEVDIYRNYTVTRMLAGVDKYLREHGQKPPKPFRGIFIMQAYDDVLPNGLTCSNVADVSAKQIGYLYPYVLNVPFTRLFNGTEADFRYVNTRFALQEKDTMFMFTVFIKAFSDLMLYLEHNWPVFVDDIANGTVSELSKATPEVVEKLKSVIKPDPERAEELRKEFEKGFDETIIKRIWPNMAVLYGIGTSTFEPFAKMSRKYTKGVLFDNSIYGASEGMFAVVDEPESAKQLLLTDSCYYEFIPLEDESRILSLDELTTGELYEIIITNQAGLYRYKTGDVIKVVGWYDDCPYIQFAFRKGQLLNVAGEKTTEEHMSEAIKRVARAADCKIGEWCTFINMDVHPYCYGLLLENDEGKDLSVYSDLADEVLREINLRYKYFVERGTLGKIRIYNLEYGTQEAWAQKMIENGTPISNFKPVRMLDNDNKLDFFLSRVLKDKDADEE